MNNYAKHIFKFFIFIALLPIFFVIATGSEWTFSGNSDVNKKDYLKFSHSKHIELGNDCTTCHTEIEKSKNNLTTHKPTHTECNTCHEEKINSDCAFCHTNPDDIQPIPKIQSELKFNHELHLTKNEFSCNTCHSDIDKTDLTSSDNFPKMSQCSTCHNGKISENNCEKCHTEVGSLRPMNHSLATFKREHGILVNLKSESECNSCHIEEDCATCHLPGSLEKISSIEKTGTLSNRNKNNISKIFTGELVHNLNYRFTHSIDAKGKSSKCQTCHQQENFCNDCHNSGSVALGGIVPTSHEQSMFVTIGVGSGGGLHAQLAKRDIETCANCHDTEGNDPNCITCHTDFDGVKNTNPKTHASKFYLNNNGIWHSDENANCYTCHTDANARPNGQSGIAFCGYCHGKKS